FLQAESPAMAIEAIGVLEKQAPGYLKTVLPDVLQSRDLGLQGRALRSLLKLDPPQGVTFLKQQFASTDPVARAYAVMHCLAVPFDLVREPLFDMLAAEEDPRILNRAAYVLFLNPEEKTVWWLMDVAVGARPAKAKWCQNVVEAVLEAIRVSGIMAGSVSDFVQKVRDFIRHRQVDTRLKSLLDELEHADPLHRYEAIEALRVYENEPEVRERFRRMYLEERDEKVKNVLAAIFAQSPDRARLQKELIPAAFQKLKVPQQMEILGQIKNVEEFTFVRDSLQALVRLHLDPYVQAEVVRLLGTYGDEKGELSPLSVALKSPEGVIVARAIEGLSRIGPKSLLKELPKLIRSPVASVRTAALKAFFQEDKIQTLSVLREMAMSNSSQAKEQALICLAQINYSSSRELLLKFVQEEGNLALVKKAGVILKGNPDPDAIRFLHQQWRRTTGPKKAALQEVMHDCIETAIAVEIIKGPPEAYLKTIES
ncbi:MAG TPA: HEAT repeat domain-containing protein, partial [Candidatus Ozemobacteraceae bacterium]|nr:HEAT repeat domain-containing protein [Candidatus Ozemobacteraceae bacterium]